MAAPDVGSTPVRAPRGRARTSQSIIGFTEAELGIFLAVLFLGLTFLGRQTAIGGEHAGTVPGADVPQAAVDPRLNELVALAARVDSLQNALRGAFVRDSVAAARVASFERTRDSLRAVRSRSPSPIPPGQETLASDAVATRLRSVERDLAVALLARDTARRTLRIVERATDSVRTLVARSAASVLASRGAATPAVVRALTGGAPPSARAGNGVSTTPRGGGRGAVYVGVAPLGAGGAPGQPSGGGAVPGGRGGRSGSGVRTIGAASTRALSGGATSAGPPRSMQTPTCIELGAVRAAIADVTILGRDRYRVRDAVGPMDAVLRALGPEREQARRLDCRQRVRVASDTTLSAEDYVVALNALLPYFDTELLRRTP